MTGILLTRPSIITLVTGMSVTYNLHANFNFNFHQPDLYHMYVDVTGDAVSVCPLAAYFIILLSDDFSVA